MSNLNHTQTIDRPRVDADPTHSTNPDLLVRAAEEPYVSFQSEARWYGDSL